ncbi:MAG TPA: flagellar hook-associated protein FlgL [Desulfobacterales bacterium]|nr:flagellar hook-associated protein FlgL [Desulfobacterales bacterium]
MRITQNMMSNIFVRNIQKQTEAMLQRQEQLASQKRINRPSDDPGGMARVLDGRSTLAAIDQYVENIKQGKSRLEITEKTLEQVDDLVQQARKLAETNSGADVTADERALAAENVKEIYDQVMQLANSRFGGRYMFSGYQTGTPAFARNDDYNATYHDAPPATPDPPNTGSFQIPIADNVKVSVDADGRNYFGDGSSGVFSELQKLINGLENTDLTAGTAQIQATVDPLEAAHAQIMNKRSEGAPKLYRLDASEQYWTHFKSQIQSAIGRDEDADITRVAVEMNNLKTAYETSMAAAARIIQRGLVDFL